MSVPGQDLLAQVENENPKLGIYLRNYILPSINSRGLAGHVLSTPTDKPGEVQLQPLTNLVSVAGVSQLVAGTNITLTPSSGKGAVTVTAAGGGTVSSVGLAVPSWQTVSGSPITGSGTLTVTDNAQPANEVFAGPASGASAAPAFRALVAADLPAIYAYVLATAPYTMLATDSLIECQGTFTVTLPSASSVAVGKPFNIKNSGTGVITVTPQAGQTIDLAASQSVSSMSNLQFASNGSNWLIL